MKTLSYESFVATRDTHWTLIRDAERDTPGEDIWGVLRFSTPDGEQVRVIPRDTLNKQILGNQAVIRIRWYSEKHFWITETAAIPDNISLDKPSDGHLRSCFQMTNKPADFALAFAVYEGCRENIWAVWGFLEGGDTLDDIQSFYQKFS